MSDRDDLATYEGRGIKSLLTANGSPEGNRLTPLVANRVELTLIPNMKVSTAFSGSL